MTPKERFLIKKRSCTGLDLYWKELLKQIFRLKSFILEINITCGMVLDHL